MADEFSSTSEPQVLPPALREHFAHILEKPEPFAQTVKARLAASNEIDKEQDSLQHLLDFLVVTDDWYHEPSCRAAKNAFVEAALVDELLETIFAGDLFSIDEEDLYQCSATISVRSVSSSLFCSSLMRTYRVSWIFSSSLHT